MRHTAMATLLAACALGAAPARSRAPGNPAPVLDRADVAAYLDGYLPFALRRADIAGAVVVVVKDGQTLFHKGYGLAEVRTGRRVDPQTTLFRPGSISKLLTWTAVMQLVAAGKLDLDRDINAYVDFPIPAPFGRPVTLRHLLTHTAGFEDAYKDILTKDAKSTPSIETYVKTALPPELFAPGSTVAYSNYGATLAGYIVQRVSGEPYPAYIQRHIFAPLGMVHSTFAQPVRASSATFGPLGYLVASQPPRPFELITTVPAGALTTTAEDMAHFMIAHLQDGAFGSERILDARTAALMHAPSYQPVPSLQAMSLGFYGEDRNGRRIIGHAGDLISFHADLHLLLDDRVGLFVAFNSLGKDTATSAVREGLFTGLVDRYFPASRAYEPTVATAVAHGKQLVGEYQLSRRAASSFVALGNLLGSGRLTMSDDGTIALSTLKDYDDEPKRWREVAPYRWRQVNGASQLVATLHDGHVAAIASDDNPPIAVWQPVATAYAASWNLPLLAATLFILMVTVFAWPTGTLLRRYYQRPTTMRGRALRLHRATCAIASIDLVFLGGWLGFLLAANTDLTLLTRASDPLLRLLQLAGAIGLLGLPLIFAHTVASYHDATRRWWSKVWCTMVALACLATAWFAVAFHFFCFGLRY